MPLYHSRTTETSRFGTGSGRDAGETQFPVNEGNVVPQSPVGIAVLLQQLEVLGLVAFRKRQRTLASEHASSAPAAISSFDPFLEVEWPTELWVFGGLHASTQRQETILACSTFGLLEDIAGRLHSLMHRWRA